MADCRRCRHALDTRGWCNRCEAAETRCPRCLMLKVAGPTSWRINWQVCRRCLLEVRDGGPALLERSHRG